MKIIEKRPGKVHCTKMWCTNETLILTVAVYVSNKMFKYKLGKVRNK